MLHSDNGRKEADSSIRNRRCHDRPGEVLKNAIPPFFSPPHKGWLGALLSSVMKIYRIQCTSKVAIRAGSAGVCTVSILYEPSCGRSIYWMEPFRSRGDAFCGAVEAFIINSKRLLCTFHRRCCTGNSY